MKKIQGEIDDQLKRILWAAFSYWSQEDQPEPERSICYSWVVSKYEERFHARFHQSRLGQLQRHGFICSLETSRAGSRRYYAIVNPQIIESLLHKWELL